jgi:hypothetical protein
MSQPISSSVSAVESEPIKYEPYRPPAVLQERVNPFDKNKPPSFDSKPAITGIYSSISTSITSNVVTSKPIDVAPKPSSTSVTSSIISSGFDYSYRPPPLPVYNFDKNKSVDKEDELPKATTVPTMSEETTTTARVRGKFERKLSDADIIFGAKTDPYIASTFNSTYSRNRSNSSFTSTSTDSEYNATSRDALKRENPFQKSLSVSSETDGDFASDPRVRSYQGIANDAFQDSFDSPKTSSISKTWSNKNDDDDDYDLK